MVPIKLLTSFQTGSPSLNNAAGSLTSLLQACLVDGYNTQTVSTLTVSSNVATVVTSTDHGYNLYDTILISGANESVFNDSFSITEITNTTTFKFSVTTAIASATGTISCKIAPLGWVREYSGTNQAVYRATVGNRIYLRIDDTITSYTNSVIMYESMTGLSTGINAKTTVYWYKPIDSTPRDWFILGSDKFFYYGHIYQSSYPNQYHVGYFGDFKSISNNNAWDTCISGCSSAGSPGTSAFFNASASNSQGFQLTRSFTFLPINDNYFSQLSFLGYQIMGRNATYSLNPIDKRVHLTKVFCVENNVLRGTIPGLYSPIENVTSVNFLNFDRLLYNNKTFIPINIDYPPSQSSPGLCFISLSSLDW